MRNALVIVVALLAGGLGFAFYRDPTGSQKVATDLESVVASLLPASMQPTPPPRISDLIKGKLISMDGSPFTFPANAPATSIQYFAIYYSAQWCAPCHAFSPVLAQWYKSFKPRHPEFELVFVSEDHDEDSMLAYMKEMSMPWPAVLYSDLRHDGNGTFKGSDIEKFAGSGIPDLVLVDAAGNVLSDSFSWSGSYLGPQHVLDDIEKLLGRGTPSSPEPAPAPASVAGSPPAPPSPAATATTASPSETTAPTPFKPWSPPAVMPAQPNWTWVALDGTTYNNVVVTEIGPSTVSITHAMGVAHDIPIANLPPDIQKQLNYDPVAAAAARRESDREAAHPYYTFAERADAQNAARQLSWPLAWMCTNPGTLSETNPDPDSEGDFAQRALSHLKSHAVIIAINGNGELSQVPPLILSQFFVLDDGPLPNGHHFYSPKIILSDADLTKTYGRITHAQLIAIGDAAFDQGLATIPTGAAGAPPASPLSATPPVPTPPTAPPPGGDTSIPPAPTEAKSWAPPEVIPAQPNWTWTTLDGTTYQNVVITKIEPDTVSITHSLGVAHIPVNMLPRDIQKQLKYR